MVPRLALGGREGNVGAGSYSARMKTCRRCGEAKDDADFNKYHRGRGGLQGYCRECQKQHYRGNAVRHRANVRRTGAARVAEMRKIIFDAMAGGCVDCGNTDIRVLEFDHVRGTKIDGIARMVSNEVGFATLRAELAKCEVRCKNCHAIATFTRLGSTWHSEYQ